MCDVSYVPASVPRYARVAIVSAQVIAAARGVHAVLLLNVGYGISTYDFITFYCWAINMSRYGVSKAAINTRL